MKDRGAKVAKFMEGDSTHLAFVDSPTMFCPYCGGKAIVAIVEWNAESADEYDKGNTAVLTEYQCEGSCQGRSFWT